MVSAQTRVELNVAEVAAKVIDGEAIIMNLSNGLYYSIDNVGAAIWELASRSHSVDEVTAAVVAHYGVDRETAAADVQRLVGELLAESLVSITERESDQPAVLPGTGAPRAYDPPVLRKYSDMADLLALDPPMPALGEGAS